MLFHVNKPESFALVSREGGGRLAHYVKDFENMATIVDCLGEFAELLV